MIPRAVAAKNCCLKYQKYKSSKKFKQQQKIMDSSIFFSLWWYLTKQCTTIFQCFRCHIQRKNDLTWLTVHVVHSFGFKCRPLCRGVSSFLKLGGQVVMWRAAAPSVTLLFCEKLNDQLPTLPNRQLRPCRGWKGEGRPSNNT